MDTSTDTFKSCFHENKNMIRIFKIRRLFCVIVVATFKCLHECYRIKSIRNIIVKCVGFVIGAVR